MLKLIPTNSTSPSQVYLAQDSKGSFVALKTVDTQQQGAEESITREMDLLSLATGHLNIVRLLGQIKIQERTANQTEIRLYPNQPGHPL